MKTIEKLREELAWISEQKRLITAPFDAYYARIQAQIADLVAEDIYAKHGLRVGDVLVVTEDFFAWDQAWGEKQKYDTILGEKRLGKEVIIEALDYQYAYGDFPSRVVAVVTLEMAKRMKK